MSGGLICPATVPIRTNEALRENRNQLHPGKGTVIVRRPFKYVKHQGPRPVGTGSASTFVFSAANGPAKIRALSIRPGSMATTHERSSHHGSKSERAQTVAVDPENRGRKNERAFGPPVSRLLSSRKLNLSALDISACHKRKSAQVEVVRDELTNPLYQTDPSLAKSPGTARLWDWFSQGRTSCFSDWSNSAPTSSRRSLTVCETPTQLYPPKSSREIAHKKRISSGPQLPMSLTRESRAFQTRSRSDFGLSNYS
ncbi:hypothetical protein PTTG_02287 [Puccinia triticina 1-1 BBBD Race 1]|uniref:Uncharacterized protein n=2 Tax=Puccinia triticina TaxID=208348 RepID=A0A0C4DFE8_PUCT1|nr:uncharacterized protein PtA15_5A317 [Puccinia triticina]OAV96039.1 hypothetical protein PTTG_02287 [Puccinia triticina 1-1 BBBD Race 1]WAQ84744.1 hypothetical protein PtA15_5A317 [Puccinia triticina]WAR58087.1 hypothetical protein PtB15_5B319 [Puccinia triticina]